MSGTFHQPGNSGLSRRSRSSRSTKAGSPAQRSCVARNEATIHLASSAQLAPNSRRFAGLVSMEISVLRFSVPNSMLGTGEVIVDVAAAGVLAYAGDVFSGKRESVLELPIVPGAGSVGRVRAAGPDATRLAVGDWVSIDPTVDRATMP